VGFRSIPSVLISGEEDQELDEETSHGNIETMDAIAEEEDEDQVDVEQDDTTGTGLLKRVRRSDIPDAPQIYDADGEYSHWKYASRVSPPIVRKYWPVFITIPEYRGANVQDYIDTVTGRITAAAGRYLSRFVCKIERVPETGTENARTTFTSTGGHGYFLSCADATFFKILDVVPNPKLSHSKMYVCGKLSADQNRVITASEKATSRGFQLPDAARSIFVYTNIIRPQIVSDQYCELLGVVPVLGERGSRIHHVFNPTYFCKLSQPVVRNIQIMLRDHSGEPLIFLDDTSPTIINLDFRRIKFSGI
jgi:hypothetical protein